MTYTFNMHEAKTKLSKLVELIESGEKVLIARDGNVVAELIEATAPTRPLLGEFEPVKVHSVSDRDEKQMQFEIEEAIMVSELRRTRTISRNPPMRGCAM